MTEKDLVQIIFKHSTDGYFLSAQGRLAARVRAEQAAKEIAFVLKRQAERPQRARTVVVQSRPS